MIQPTIYTLWYLEYNRVPNTSGLNWVISTLQSNIVENISVFVITVKHYETPQIIVTFLYSHDYMAWILNGNVYKLTHNIQSHTHGTYPMVTQAVFTLKGQDVNAICRRLNARWILMNAGSNDDDEYDDDQVCGLRHINIKVDGNEARVWVPWNSGWLLAAINLIHSKIFTT